MKIKIKYTHNAFRFLQTMQTCWDPINECTGGQTNTAHLWGFFVDRNIKSINKKRPSRQETVSRIAKKLGKLSSQGDDLVQKQENSGAGSSNGCTRHQADQEKTRQAARLQKQEDIGAGSRLGDKTAITVKLAIGDCLLWIMPYIAIP